jgi:spore maturation protein CgeB
MKKSRILLLDNGFKAHKNHFIESVRSNNAVISKIIYNYPKRKNLFFVERLFLKFRLPVDLSFFNYRFLKEIIFNQYDYIIIIKGNNILPITILITKFLFPKIPIVSWSLDNMIKKHNSSLYFKHSIPLYDIVFTTKTNTIEQFINLKAKRVEYITQAFSRFEHYSDQYFKDYDFGILFIGSPEKDRIEKLLFLSDKNILVNIFGNGWEKFNLQNHSNIIINNKELVGEDYRKAIRSSSITLNFLRKINDDLHTSRTFEIPACGGFMISERSSEHSDFFVEDKEAVYFDDARELYEKITYYINNEKNRNEIRINGYKKVQEINNTYCRMFEEMLLILKE